MEWELRHVEDTGAVLDDSRVYVVINRVEHTARHKEYSGIRVTVRADLMDGRPIGSGETSGQPIMSFAGSANAVRKELARFLKVNYGFCQISMEHAAYIGYELLRAELTPGYVQD